MIFYGTRASTISTSQVVLDSCPTCGNSTSFNVSIFGRYAHLYWIPLFSIGKVAVAECNHCKRTYKEEEMPLSLKQSVNALRNQAKTPIWHFALLLIIGAFVVFSMISNAFKKEDPREKLFKADVETLKKVQVSESDSTSKAIKMMFDLLANEEIKPEDFHYFTKIQGDKALILLQIEKLKSVQKDGRNEVVELIEKIAENRNELKDKKLYIGVHGNYNFMMIKTPTVSKSSKIEVPDPLYDFYGDVLK